MKQQLNLSLMAAIVLCPAVLLAEALVVGNETIEFTEGEHAYDSITMNPGQWRKAQLLISGGSISVTGTTKMNGLMYNTTSDFAIYGSATAALGAFNVNDSWQYGNGTAYLTVSNTAAITFGNFSGSMTGSGHFYLTVTDNARAIQDEGASYCLPSNGNAPVPYNVLTVKGHGYAEFNKITLWSPYTTIRTEGHGTLVVRGDMNLNNGQSDHVIVADDSTLIVRGNTDLLTSGEGILVKDRGRFIQASGYMDLGWSGSPICYLTVSNQAAVVSTNNINVGRAETKDSPLVFVRLCEGGTLEIPGFQYGRLAYWANDTWKRSMTNLYCEGGVMKAMKDNADYIRYWKYAQLVGAGLTVDTAGHAIGVEQWFVGTTFTKTGLGTLTTRTNSLHQTTAVAEGTVVFGPLAETFGQNLVVTNGATVSTAGTSTGFAVDSITLGDAASAGVLALDADDTVTVATASGLHFVNGRINHPSTDADGTYDIFIITSGVPTAEQLKGLSVYAKTLGKKYKFAAVADGDGAKVQLTVSTVQIVSDAWTGAESSAWQLNGNWASGSFADEYTIATFPTTATTKGVTLAEDNAANKMILNDAYTFTGAGSLTTGAIDVNAGTSTVGVALNVASTLPIANPAGTGLNLAGNVSGVETVTISKKGTGVLNVSGDNADYRGGWTTDGGYLVFDGDTAAGTDEPTEGAWTLNGGTVVFTNGTQTLSRSVTMDPGSTTAMVVCVEGDTTIDGGLDALSGGFVQRGKGTLTLKYGPGTKYLGKNVLGGSPSAEITFPADGSSPASSSLAAINVLSGTLRLEGQGLYDTTWSANMSGVEVGGNWPEAPSSARLEITKGIINDECSHSFCVGNYVSSPNATRPTVFVGTEGRVWSTWGTIGRENTSFAGDVYPTLALTNGTFASYLSTSIGCDSATSKVHPVLRIGAGGWLYAPRSGLNRAYSYSLSVGHDLDAEVADGGYIDTGCWGFYLAAAASGEIRFKNSGRLYGTSISSRDAATTTDPFKFVFDGGIYQPTLAHTTSVHNASIRTVELRNGGMTFRANVNHTLAMRLTGSGDLTKEGTGVLTFAKDNECLSHKQAEEDVITLGDSGYKTLDFTGTLYVNEGSVVIEPGAARAGLKIEIASGKSADFGGGAADAYAVSGAGTVQNATGGTLALMAKSGVTPTLDALALGCLFVDFSSYGTTLKKGDQLTVAKLTNASNIAHYKATQVNGGSLSATFSVDADGNLIATICEKPGLLLLVK